MEPRFEVKTCWERGAWGIHSARAVPAQCPHSARDSARLENKAVPAVLSFLERKRKPLYPFKIKEPRALLCFPGGHCRGHCAGTARALRGHCVFPRRRVTSGRQAAERNARPLPGKSYVLPRFGILRGVGGVGWTLSQEVRSWGRWQKR